MVSVESACILYSTLLHQRPPRSCREKSRTGTLERAGYSCWYRMRALDPAYPPVHGLIQQRYRRKFASGCRATLHQRMTMKQNRSTSVPAREGAWTIYAPTTHLHVRTWQAITSKTHQPTSRLDFISGESLSDHLDAYIAVVRPKTL